MDFIQITDNALSQTDCQNCIDLFEWHPELHNDGVVVSEESDATYKKSTDAYLSFAEVNSFNQIILPHLTKSLRKYKSTYDSFNFAPDWTLCSLYNIQRYLPGEGYYSWHSEVSFIGTPPNPLYSTRVLAWMIYLNDVDDGGTEFMNQKTTIDAKCGRCVVWPATWTHTHRGRVSETKTKYIATGWCNYIIELY